MIHVPYATALGRARHPHLTQRAARLPWLGEEGKGFPCLEMRGGDPWAGRTPAVALGETGIPPPSSAGCGPRAAHAIPGSILPGSSSPPVGFLKPQSESVPPTWLLVPGGTASPAKHPCAPQGLCCTPTPLWSSWSSLSCGGASLHLALGDGVRGWPEGRGNGLFPSHLQ